MISKKAFTKEYIQELHEKTGSDPALLERVIFAFGLLEAIRKVNLPFCFKGGTSLMLLLKHPKRLSTDIDIIVEPGTCIDEYIKKAGKIFPFVDVVEDIRVGKNKIEKRHFRFMFYSPVSNRNFSILLNVVFEKLPYQNTIFKAIENDFLIYEGENLMVAVPTVNSILGDKLTAFAPHTTGIPFGIKKELEIIKQLFDCGSLFDVMDNYDEVKDTYAHIVKSELSFRGLLIPVHDVLADTIGACLCIVSRGNINGTDYKYYMQGISRIRNHIIGNKFTGEIAGVYASKILYLSASILANSEPIKVIDNQPNYSPQQIKFPNPNSFSYLRIVDSIAYHYVAKAGIILNNKGFRFVNEMS